MVTLADIAPEGILLAGAGRAILLQIALPGVGYGVARHSDFAARPMKRLNATLRYIYALSNGDADDIRRMRRAVDRAHGPVANPPRGDGRAAHPDDPRYDARAPELQLWVAATLYDTAITVYERVFGALPDAEAERVYREYAVLGTALQMPPDLWPRDRAAFADYWNGMLPRLAADRPIRTVARELLRAEKAALPIRLAMPLARVATVGLLPPSVRALFGFGWTSRQQRYLDRVFAVVGPVYRVLPRVVRRLPQRYYLDRLARSYP